MVSSAAGCPVACRCVCEKQLCHHAPPAPRERSRTRSRRTCLLSLVTVSLRQSRADRRCSAVSHCGGPGTLHPPTPPPPPPPLGTPGLTHERPPAFSFPLPPPPKPALPSALPKAVNHRLVPSVGGFPTITHAWGVMPVALPRCVSVRPTCRGAASYFPPSVLSADQTAAARRVRAEAR